MKGRDNKPLDNFYNNYEKDFKKYSNRNSKESIEEVIYKRKSFHNNALQTGLLKDKTIFDYFQNNQKQNHNSEMIPVYQIATNNEKEQKSAQIVKSIVLQSPQQIINLQKEESIGNNQLKGRKLTQRKVMEIAQIKAKQLPAHLCSFEFHKEKEQYTNQNVLQNINNNINQQSHLNEQNNQSCHNHIIKQTKFEFNKAPNYKQNTSVLTTSNFESLQSKNGCPFFSPKRNCLLAYRSPSIRSSLQNRQQIIISDEKSNRDSLNYTIEQQDKTSTKENDVDFNEDTIPKRKNIKVSISYFVDPNFPEINKNRNHSVKARDQQYISFSNKLKQRQNIANTIKYHNHIEKHILTSLNASNQDSNSSLENNRNLPLIINSQDINILSGTHESVKKSPILFSSFPLNPNEQNDTGFDMSSHKNTKGFKVNCLKKQNTIAFKENLSKTENSNQQKQAKRNQMNKNNIHQFGVKRNKFMKNGNLEQNDNRQMAMITYKKLQKERRLKSFHDMDSRSNLFPNPLTKSLTENEEIDEFFSNDRSYQLLIENISTNLSNINKNRQFYQGGQTDERDQGLNKFVFNSKIFKQSNNASIDIVDKSNQQKEIVLEDKQQETDSENMQKSENILNKNKQINSQKQYSKQLQSLKLAQILQRQNIPTNLAEIYKIEATKDMNYQNLREYYDQKYNQRQIFSPHKTQTSFDDKRKSSQETYEIMRNKGISLHETPHLQNMQDSQGKQQFKLSSQTDINNDLQQISQTSTIYNSLNCDKYTKQTKKNSISQQNSFNDTLSNSIRKVSIDTYKNQQTLSQQFTINTEEQEKEQSTQTQIESITIQQSSTKKTSGGHKQSFKTKQLSLQKDKVEFDKLEPWDSYDKQGIFHDDYLNKYKHQ